MKLAIQRLVVRASVQRVFELFTDPALFIQWMAPQATLDPIPGGVVRWTHPNGDTVSGRYVEVALHRIVFTYGWERQEVGIPAGSTTVEIDLVAQPDGSTVVTLVHRGLDGPAADAHNSGWAHYLNRMRRVGEGKRLGADPWANQRVPTRQQRQQMTRNAPTESDFWDLAQPLIDTGTVTRSTMMGLPCLRVDGRFFASFDPRTNSLLVKLSAARVDELIDANQGNPFAPAGRTFRQWTAITPSRSTLWPSLIEEALDFATRQHTLDTTLNPNGSKFKK